MRRGDRFEPLRGDVLDVGLARRDRLELARVDVDRDHVAARLGEATASGKPT